MIRKKQAGREVVIDLDGPDGNVFALMGILGDVFKRSGIDPSPQIAAMQSGDYLNAIKVFNDCLGGTFVLETSNQEYIDVLEQRKEFAKIKHSDAITADTCSVDF